MVAERVGRPVLQEVHDKSDRPVGRAAAAMTSSEIPGTIIPDQESPGIQEEQEVGVTPTRARGPESVGGQTPVSSPSELGSILSASDDDSRPVTKREIELLQVRLKGMFSNLRAALNDEAVSYTHLRAHET